VNSPEWTIQPAEPADAALLARMHAESFRAAYLHHDGSARDEQVLAEAADFESPERVETRAQLILRALANSDEEFYAQALDQRDMPIGLAYGFKDDDSAELGALYITPEYFSRGLGQALASSFLAWCDPEKPVTLGVVEDNSRAQRFYRRLGFVASNDPRESYYDFLPEVTMIKQLGDTQ
jgi:GNAT superfamily N-acetyltransferase